MMVIDKLAYSSPLRHKSTELKAAFSVGTLLLCVWARSVIFSVLILALISCLAVFYGRVAFRRYCGLMALPFAFLLPSTAAVVLRLTRQPSGQPALRLGVFWITTDRAALLYGFTLLLTALASAACLYLFALTTPMTELPGLLRRLHCPALLTELLFLTYRFIFILLDTATALHTAQKCRLSNRNFKTALRAAAALIAVLLQRALLRSSQLYTAMQCRCYDGQLRVLSRKAPASTGEKAAVTAALLLLATLAACCKLSGEPLWLRGGLL